MFACIFIPDFSVQAVIRFEPELRARPVVVLAGRPPLEKVVSLNESARQIGVDIGATKSQLEAWEGLILRSRSESQEMSAHGALLDCAQSFSPEIEDTAPGIVLLNLAGLEPLLGPRSKIANGLLRRTLQLGLKANVAVAANPDAALLAARGFHGVTLIPEGHEAERLGELTIDVLLESFFSDAAEAANWAETLDRWGIRKLRSLAALPQVPLSERLGQQGIRLQKLAQGEVSRNLLVLEPPPPFTESAELEFPIVLLEPLAFLLNCLLQKVCARLSSHALAAQELTLTLDLAVLPACDSDASALMPAQTLPKQFVRSLRLPTPMLDARVFLKLLQLDLQAHPPGAPIVKIHLSVMQSRPRAVQSGLFQPIFPEPEKLELTLARIAGVVGEGRVGAAELLDTHREGAFVLRHFAPIEMVSASPGAKQNRKKDRSMPENQIAQEIEEKAREKMTMVIALRLYRPPLAASVTVREAKPVWLRCLHRGEIAGEIVWTAGPWRSSGDWSEQEGWSREEWDIAVSSETGLALYRLVQDKLGGNWFVEGMYD